MGLSAALFLHLVFDLFDGAGRTLVMEELAKCGREIRKRSAGVVSDRAFHIPYKNFICQLKLGTSWIFYNN
jgi:hypothetical protein